MSATPEFHHPYTDPEEHSMDTAEFTDNLSALLLGDLPFDEAFPDATGAVTFEEAGVLTSNDGLVVRLFDGTEFQVTVVRSR